MSPASKAKSKDKKAGKDPQKGSLKPSGLVASTAGGTPVSGYNPLLGKFHTIETAPYSSASSLQVNGRFRNIDETDDYSGSSAGNGMEYDTISNNDSWSGESEDHKDKTNSLRQEVIPGADCDKREKIRQKNERKHQRQKERRAQELHERCNVFLMSRKLEALAQQLVAMGFSQERATMALILNEGKMEESVAWLFEAGEGAAPDTLKAHQNLDGGNLKIDISDELARIADMEIRYKCSRQEVERAIVTCEGDLEKAVDALRVQKQDSPCVLPKPDETGDPPTSINDNKRSHSNSHNNPMRIQPKLMPSTIPYQKRDDKDFNYTKTVAATNGVVSIEPGTKNVHALRKVPSKPEWVKPQQQMVTSVDKRLSAAASNPSVSYSLPSTLQATLPLAKAEAHYTALGNELKNLQLGLVKEPVTVMQRPQSANSKQVPTTIISSSSSPNVATSGGWFPNNVELGKLNGLPNRIPNGLSSQHTVPSTRSIPSHINFSSSNQMYSQLHYQQQQQQQQHYPQYVSNNGMMDSAGASSRGNSSGLWNKMGGSSSPTLAVASSLGLFTGGSQGSSSSMVDWNTGGSMGQLDYANIDWSLDRSSSMPSSGSWNVHGYDAYSSLGHSAMRSSAMSNGGGSGSGLVGLQESAAGGGHVASSGETSAAGAREWSSPFEEKDLFSLPRQFVFSPSL